MYLLDGGEAIVASVDFFPPLVDDPADFGAIAAANALSDLYAMRARPIFALNVLAYLTDTEERKFYEHAKRIIRPNGVLIVTHSNELFDMYTLNRFTVEFYREHFSFTGIDTSVAQLLTNPELAERSERQPPQDGK